MSISKNLQIAIVLSFGLHLVLLSPVPGIGKSQRDAAPKSVEVTYVTAVEEKPTQKKAVAAQPPPAQAAKVTLKDETPTAKPKETPAQKDKDTKQEMPSIAKTDQKRRSDEVLPSKKNEAAFLPEATIDLTAITPHAGDSESLNFLTSVRDKISIYVHRNYSPSMGEGEALLHFILNSDGSVQSVDIIDDGSRSNDGLKRLCIESIRLSSPFKAFPKALDLPTATFKITISFKRR